MMNLANKVKKYSGPIFCFAAARRAQRIFSVWVWTAYAKLLLRMLGCSYGKGLKVDGMLWVRVRSKKAVKIGNNVTINSRFGSNLVGLNTPTVLECLEGGSIFIGSKSGLSGVVLSSRQGIYIGERVMIGGNVRIFDHDYHSTDYRTRVDTYADMKACARADVSIGNDAFIGTNAMILKGVSVGDRSVVAAGAIVAKNVPSDEIWGGNPAKKIKALEWD